MTSFIFKILTAGDGGVGKTTLLHRYVTGEFLFDTTMTLGVQVFKKEIQIEDKHIMLQLWDFGGQEQFKFMLKHYVYGAHGAIIMFDLTRVNTLQQIKEWIKICNQENLDIPIILIGSKADLVDFISVDEEIEGVFEELFDFLDYLKVSSKTGEKVNDLFKILINKMVEIAQNSY